MRIERLFAALVVTAPLALAALAVWADASGGVSGYVYDEQTKAPIPGAAVLIMRQAPVTDGRHESVLTDKHGFFVNLGLQPGRYAVTANIGHRAASCVVDDVNSGQMRRMKIYVSQSEGGFTCVGPRIHAGVVDPNETSDVYRIK